MAKEKIFITGGAGYVGSVLVPYLISKGYEITVLDLMLYGNDVLKKNKKLRIIKGDIRNQKLLKENIPGHNHLIHLACISNDPSFELNPKLGESINLEAFDPLVKISKKSNIKRFIFASSSSVYGIKEEKDVHEKISLKPLTDYSRFKAECEKILLRYKSNDFFPIIIRPATVCGYSPRQRLDVVVNILTNLAYHNREIIIFGGSQLRPNIHIKDMAVAYEKLLTSEISKVSGEIFNAGYENVSVNDLALMVQKNIGKDVKLVKSETDDNRSYHISSKKIERILGFKPSFTINDAISDLKKAFESGLLKNSLTDKKYFNIKMMQSVNLK